MGRGKLVQFVPDIVTIVYSVLICRLSAYLAPGEGRKGEGYTGTVFNTGY